MENNEFDEYKKSTDRLTMMAIALGIAIGIFCTILFNNC